MLDAFSESCYAVCHPHANYAGCHYSESRNAVCHNSARKSAIMMSLFYAMVLLC